MDVWLALWCMVHPYIGGWSIHQSSDVWTCIPMNWSDYMLPTFFQYNSFTTLAPLIKILSVFQIWNSCADYWQPWSWVSEGCNDVYKLDHQIKKVKPLDNHVCIDLGVLYLVFLWCVFINLEQWYPTTAPETTSAPTKGQI